VGLAFDEDALAVDLEGNFDMSICVGSGEGSAIVVTTDLTPDYVRFNGERS
jgi:N-acetylglutamate synthase/N-acetylornithine aminotransferase